ncbi:glycosyltransferase family 4 protein [Candidatus Poseidoniales archaeon]|nr:glycosyltransferase family 4 protein [Candidatus Poseidoniales archaeon]
MVRVLSVGSVNPENGGKTKGGVARFHSSLIQSWMENPELGIELVGVAALNSDKDSDPKTGVPYLQNREGNSEQRMRSIIQEVRPDCIVFHHISNAWAAAISKIETSATIIGFAHSWLYCRPENNQQYHQNLDRVHKTLTKIDHLLFLSKHCHDEMDEFIQKPDCKISIIPPPLPVLSTNQTKFENNSKSIQVAYLGNLLSHKNPFQLVKALQFLDGVELILIGSGKEETEINQYIRENNLNHKVKIETNLSDSKVSEFLYKADVFCMPSEYEAFGLVYLEALDHGLPIVGFGPSIKTIEEEMGIKCGIALSDYSPHSIAEAISACLTRPWDREKLQKKVREVFNPYSISKRFADLILNTHSAV